MTYKKGDYVRILNIEDQVLKSYINSIGIIERESDKWYRDQLGVRMQDNTLLFIYSSNVELLPSDIKDDSDEESHAEFLKRFLKERGRA